MTKQEQNDLLDVIEMKGIHPGDLFADDLITEVEYAFLANHFNLKNQ